MGVLLTGVGILATNNSPLWGLRVMSIMFQIVVVYVFACWVYTLGTIIRDAPMLFGMALGGTLCGMSVRRARVCFVVGAFVAMFLSPLYLLYSALVIILSQRR